MKSVANIVFAVLLACFFVSSAHAAPDLKVGYVDMQKALAESKAGKAAQKDYEKELQDAQEAIEKKKNEYESLRDAYQKQQASLNAKAKAEKEEKLLSLERDLKRDFKDSQDSLRRMNSQLVGGLVEDLKKAVDEVGKKEGFTFILERSSQSVLYADSALDVTEKVVKAFDAMNR